METPERSDSTAAMLFDFADQLLADREAGRLLPLAHYLARFPGHEEAVAREYLALTSERAEGVPSRAADRVGPYRLLEVVGRGGQGVVWRALDLRLERVVALKVLGSPFAGTGGARRERFRREAGIVARLDHPGLCTVLDADLEGETPYIAMRYVEGETLAVALARARVAPADAASASSGPSTAASRLLAPRDALSLAASLAFFERAARALHAAHEAGVVHRDVKPGNLMVSEDGSPVVLDFGLARADEGEEPLTRSDDVFGTPAYVSPEQVRGGRRVDRRADVWALGVVLYECLTLARPFGGDSGATLAHEILSAAPPPVRKLNPYLPPDLAVVVETALEKDVARRYPTALELAEELRRVRVWEPIRARPAGPLLRLSRWARRNPAVATATIGSIAALSLALGITLVLLGRVREEQGRKEAALHRYEAAWYRDRAAAALGASPPRSLHFAIAAAEREPGFAGNRALLAALDSLYTRELLIGHEGVVIDVDVDRASRRVLTCSLDGTVRVWDALSGQELARLALRRGPALAARFSPDGSRVVAAGTAGELVVWSLDAPAMPGLDLAGHADDVTWAEFDPAGERVVSASGDRTARVWSARDGRELARLEGHTGNVAYARFLGTRGELVLTRSSDPRQRGGAQESDHTLRVFDAASGVPRAVLRGHAGPIVACDVTRDLRWVASASADRTARLWRLPEELLRGVGGIAADTGELALGAATVLALPGHVHDASFSPDGRRLALAFDAGARVVDVEGGAVLYELPSHGRRAVVRAEFSPDGERLATVAYDDALRFFRARDGALLRTCRGEVRQLSGVVWSADGSFLSSWQRGPTVELWYGDERPFLPVLRGHEGEVRSARFDRAGARVLTASADGTARVWSASSAHAEAVLDPREHGLERDALVAARFDPAERRVATTDATGRVRVWDLASREPRSEHRAGGPAAPVAAFSADGARLALAGAGGAVALVELATGRERTWRAHDDAVACLAFSPDGARLATGGEDRRVCVWDASFAAGAPPRETAGVPVWRGEPFATDFYKLKSVFDVAFSPDGHRLAAACQNLEVLLFDAGDGRVHARSVVATPGRVAFADEGRLLFVTSKYFSTASLWGVREGDGEPLERFDFSATGAHHSNSVTSVATSGSGARAVAVTGSLDATARLWDLAAREIVAGYAGHADAVLDVDVSPDGASIVTASAAGTARLWPSDLLGAARTAEPKAFAASLGPLPTPAARE